MMVWLQSLHSVGVVTIKIYNKTYGPLIWIMSYLFPIFIEFAIWLLCDFEYYKICVHLSSICGVLIFWIQILLNNVTWVNNIVWNIYYLFIMIYIWWGSYSLVYVPPPIGIVMVLMVYIHIVFLCIVYAYFYTQIYPLYFPSTNSVTFIHNWMKNFRGCMHMYYIICS